MDDFMSALDDWVRVVEMLTGMKKQMIEAGWSAEMAEEMVLCAFEMNLGGRR